MSDEERVRVLFVCLGNICRSPMAEAIFRHQVREAGWEDRVRIDSAGTGAWSVGAGPHHGTLEILRAHGIDPGAQRARKLTLHDLREFDWILPMDRENLRDIQELGPATAKVELMLRFGPDSGRLDVPDPFLQGGFDAVYELLVDSCRGLWDRIAANQGW